jgi:cytochrome c peroxidase
MKSLFAHPIRPFLIASTLAIGACAADDPAFTDAERELLESMVLDDTTAIPPSRTNRYADDLAAAELGQAVFFDNRFTTTATTCRACHDTTSGGADTKAKGPFSAIGMTTLSRNTPTLFNASFITAVNHWAGNFTALWSVPSDVGTSALKMAHMMYVDPYYRSAYEAVFGPMPPMEDIARFPAEGNYRSPAFMMMAVEDQKAIGRFSTNIGKALEAYSRKLVDKNAPFDRYMNGEETAMPAAAVRGAKLFVGRAGCNECHNGPAFSDFKFHNIGVPRPTGANVDYGFIAAGAFQSTYPYNANSEYSDDPDYGTSLASTIMPITTADLPVVCGGPDPMPNCGAFKTPRLRSVALTAPYMHTGGISNLWDVVTFYNDAAGTDGFVGKRDASIRPLLLEDDELEDLVAFLNALTGAPIPEQWARCPTSIPATACTAP